MFVLLCLAACGSDENLIETPNDGNNNPPKEYLVSLGFSGEITDIEETPLSRTTSNDLYGIQVYSSPVAMDDYKPYAYGLFDNKESMVVKLLDGYKYKFVATMVVDGKNRIENIEGKYPYPFCGEHTYTELNNNFTYTNNAKMSFLAKGFSSLSESILVDRPNTLRFYGETDNYTPSENLQVSINLKKVYFGIKVIAENLKEGEIVISIEETPNNLAIRYPQTEIQEIYTFRNRYSDNTWTKDDYTETIPVGISWNKVDGSTIPLVSQNITFKRNKLTTITVKVKDSSMNNGVDITEEEEAMQSGDNIVIDTSNPGDTDVDPNV